MTSPYNFTFKNINGNFLETGSYTGDGIQRAIDIGFTNIISIELSDKYYEFCKNKFANNPSVRIVKGDSYFMLKQILSENPQTGFTYWLDGHYSGGETGFGIKEFPIIEELKTILSRGVTGEIIYIDDMRLLRGRSTEININTMLEIVKQYKPMHNISFLSSEYDQHDIMIIEY